MISILVPMHNVEPFLPALFRALDRQTCQDWEVVAVDDGSIDGSLAVAREYAARDSRVRVFDRGEASGAPLLPRLEAARHARGEWICPLDADDWVCDGYLDALLARAAETGADLVYPLMLNHRKDAQAPPTEILDRGVIDTDRVYCGRDLVIHTLYGWKFGCNGALYRRDLYLKAFGEVADMEEIEEYRVDTRKCARNYAPMPGAIRHTAIPYIDEIATRLLMFYADRVAFAPKAEYHYISNPASVVDSPSIVQFRGLGTDWYLRESIRTHYGEGSPEWCRMHLQLGCDLVTKMVTYHRSRRQMSPAVRDECHAWLRYTYAHLPWHDLRGALTTGYYHTLHLGFLPALHLFSLLKRN